MYKDMFMLILVLLLGACSVIIFILVARYELLSEAFENQMTYYVNNLGYVNHFQKELHDEIGCYETYK